MSRPEVDEVMFAYIAVASHAVSLVLIQVDDGVQRPIYYVSKSLHEVEIRYLPLEKVILAMVHGTRKLLITSNHTRSLSSPSSRLDLYFEVLITPGELPNGGRS